MAALWQIDYLYAFDGPNLYSHQPGVAAQLRAGQNATATLRATLKQYAQRVGVVLGFLQIDATSTEAHPGSYLHTIWFACPTPSLGAALLRLAVDTLDHPDDEMFQEQLFALQQQRRITAPPVQLLQLRANAEARSIPTFFTDTTLQLGHGIRGLSIPYQAHALASPGELLQVASTSSPPATDLPEATWATLGRIPIIASTGMFANDLVPHLTLQTPEPYHCLQNASFAANRAALCDPAIAGIITVLDATTLAQHGLPFDQCSAALIAGIPVNASEVFVRTLCLPALITAPHGFALILGDHPCIHDVLTVLPCPTVLLSEGSKTALQHQWSAQGGMACWVHDQQIIAARGTHATALLPLNPQQPAALQIILAAYNWITQV